MNTDTEQTTDLPASPPAFDFAASFRADYPRIVKVIARAVSDRARAEELAVDVFWRFWRTPKAQGAKAGGWLYRTAIRIAIDELRRRKRREQYEKIFTVFRPNWTPEQRHLETERQQQVRAVLARMKPRDAELLLLRSDDLTYQEIAQLLELNPASIGTLLSRAQDAFRKEYTRRYGKQL